MTSRRCCCENAVSYYILRPCFNETVAETVYMASSDFNTCGFSFGSIYSWDTGNPADDPYCGFWQFSQTVTGDRLDTTCANYTLNTEGCCGGDCFADTECCGFDQCYDWYESNALELVDVTGFSGGGGSTTDWSVSVSGVSASAGYWSGGAFKYDVTVSIAITVDGIGTLECDGQSTFTTNGSYSFTVTHDKSSGCLTSADSGLTYPDPDCGIRLCTGTTSNGGPDSDDCSKVTASVGTVTASTPDLGNDCLTQAAYSLTVPVNYTLAAGNQIICTACDSDGRWASAAFPDVSISTTLTLSGTWAP